MKLSSAAAPHSKLYFHLPRPCSSICLLLVLLSCAFSANAQTQFSRIYGPSDRDISVPDTVPTVGTVDAAALEEIVEHLKAVGGGVWQDMSGTGQITYSGASQGSSATLKILGANRYRLDSGIGSLIVNGSDSEFESTAGKKTFPGPEFARQGIDTFARPRVSSFPDANTSLLEKGTESIGGRNLHRISVVQALPHGTTHGNPSANNTPANFVVTDLYFDPVSHLLIKSAANLRLGGSGNEEFLECMTYDDYREVQGTQVPFRYTETLNGQMQWTLQLDTVTLNSGVQPSSFNF
jgi:hypothetical protein